MRALAFAWVSFVSTGLAHRTYAVSEGNQHRRSAFEIENRAGARNADALASLFFAANPDFAAGLRTRSAIGRPSSVRSRQQSRLAKQLPRMVVGDVSESESENSEDLDELSSKVMSSTIAFAFALAPLAASAAPPDIYKVDKTGIIGGAANIIENGIDFAHDGLVNAGVGSAYGISIILFTLLIKTITLPLLNVQLESTSKMQKITPLQKRIMASYGPSEEQDKNVMISRLFQSAEVNPLAALLPAFAQIPIFISLYRALQNLIAEDKLNDGFLWVPSLEGPVSGNGGMDWLTSSFSGNPVWGYEGTLQFLSLTLILWVVQTLSIKINTPPREPGKKMTEQEEMTQSITGILPLILSFFSLNVPAGLTIYWIFNSIITTTFTFIGKSFYANQELSPVVDQISEALDRRDKAKKKKNKEYSARMEQSLDKGPGGFKAYAPSKSKSKVKVKVKKSEAEASRFAEKPVLDAEDSKEPVPDAEGSEPLEAEMVTVQAATTPKQKKKSKKDKKNKKKR